MLTLISAIHSGTKGMSAGALGYNGGSGFQNPPSRGIGELHPSEYPINSSPVLQPHSVQDERQMVSQTPPYYGWRLCFI